ncbi:MAG: N-6 DNA methylase [Bacteroidales bacterium]
MTQKQLEDYLWGAANILRGMIDAADFKQYIFPLLFFKRVSDLWDEEYQTALDESGGDLTFAEFAENHRFQIPEGCHWEDVRKKTVDVGAYLQKALNGIEKANFEMLHDVFGDAQWTNKRRMSDEKMLDLIEHFNQMNLSVANVPHDIMGEGYEYLIKKFADDSGHTAAEFYTNRTVVKLMTQITDPQSTESIYDPTCGSGGILLSSALHLKAQGKEYRTLKLYGQELNLITSAIARINMFMHNVDEFLIVQGDTLDSPQILENDELKKFDVIMANPPYSVKKWSQSKWMNDPFGRNIWGTPPQGCADYAFQQHIMKSLNPETGRSVVLWPHGVLFRDVESDIRKKMIAEDYVDAVIGLGKNLFYNSSMESCLLVCRMKKPDERKGKILFIDAKEELRIERKYAWLEPKHINKISNAYWKYKDIEGFATIVGTKTILENNANLNIQLYFKQNNLINEHNIDDLISEIKDGQKLINNSLQNLYSQLNKIGINNDAE